MRSLLKCLLTFSMLTACSSDDGDDDTSPVVDAGAEATNEAGEDATHDAPVDAEQEASTDGGDATAAHLRGGHGSFPAGLRAARSRVERRIRSQSRPRPFRQTGCGLPIPGVTGGGGVGFVSTHLAYSDDNGTTWCELGTVNPSESVPPEGPTAQSCPA